MRPAITILLAAALLSFASVSAAEEPVAHPVAKIDQPGSIQQAAPAGRVLWHEYTGDDHPYFGPRTVGSKRTAQSQSTGVYDPTFLGSTLWSGVMDVVYEDTLAYLGMRTGLMVLNIADPTAPTFVSKLYIPEGFSLDMEIRDNLLYLAWWTGRVHVIDITDPAAAYIAGTFDTRAIPRGIDVVDTLLYVAYGDFRIAQGLQIVNASDPSVMTELGNHSADVDYLSVRVTGDKAFVTGGGYIFTFDVSDPTAPDSLAAYSTGFFPLEIRLARDDTLLYVGDLSPFLPSMESAFSIYNVADPNNIVLVDQWVVEGQAGWNVANDSVVFLSNGSRGLKVLDISNPANIDSVGHFPLPAFAGPVAIHDTMLVIADLGPQPNSETPAIIGPLPYTGADERDVLIVNIADHQSPTLAGYYDLPGEVVDVAVSGGYAYVMTPSWVGPDIYTVDITDRTNPVVVDSLETGGLPRDLITHNGYLYVAADTAGIQVLSLIEPARPTTVSVIRFSPSSVRGLTAHQTTLFAGVGGPVDLAIIDIGDPANPIVLATEPTPVSPRTPAYRDGYVYLTQDLLEGLIVDVHDLTDPRIVGKFGPPCDSLGEGGNPCSIYTGMKIVGDNLYPLTPWGFEMFSLHGAPEEPNFLWGYGLAPSTFDADINESYAYVGDGWSGVHIVDISNPPSLPEVGNYDSPGYPHGITLSNDYLFLADNWAFQILQLPTATAVVEDPQTQLPETPVLSQNFPNPFNPETVIKYDLPTRSSVRLNIYNVLGQLVTTLVNSEQPAGNHTAVWAGEDVNNEPVASGVYFYRLEVDGTTQTRKMLLLR